LLIESPDAVVHHFAEDGGDAKRTEDVGSAVVPDTALLNDDGEFQLASAVRFTSLDLHF